MTSKSLKQQRFGRGILASCCLLSCSILLPIRLAAEPARHPVVLELFTSEGCSSCPPADRLFEKLADRPDTLALAYHIDYWDSLGWKDLYSSPAATARQRGYASAKGTASVYTPQMIVAGDAAMVGSREAEIRRAIETVATQGPWQPIAVSEEGGMLHLRLPAAPSGGELVLIGYQAEAETKVTRGENSGETLHGRNIVREIRPLGKWNGRALDRQEALPAGDHAAVLLQSSAFGPIIGGGVLADAQRR